MNKKEIGDLSSLTVQLFTIPPIVTNLDENYFLLEKIIGSLSMISSKSIKKENNFKFVLDKESSQNFNKLLIDIDYLFYNKYIKRKFILKKEIFNEYLKFLTYNQNSLKVLKSTDTDDKNWVYNYFIEIYSFNLSFNILNSLFSEDDDNFNNNNNNLFDKDISFYILNGIFYLF
jgi:hypothetical protein